MQVTENLDYIESASADWVSVVAILTVGYFSNTLLGEYTAGMVMTQRFNQSER
ncbi:hypothetical protein [Leptodesmis sp.]|uniref:hypothetical protein n=1 Tax=Leptodesmis sp. TaxID=3100501 RepID=UPI0040535285